MKQTILAVTCLLVTLVKGYGQQYMTRSGFVGFYSKTPAEDIKAENHQGYAIIDEGKKNLAFAVLIKGFTFPKELMQEHFNENYIESDKYPKATFSGAYTGDVTPGQDGVYHVNVKGNLTIHGVTKPVEMPATIERKGGALIGHAVFHISPEDFNVSIPSIVREKIEKSFEVQVDIQCQPTK
ncbi:YceI family protein [Dinghuibacter silviterrae]|uniref:YceI-like domain-containing protein n=1 Tax=Dinghuibacter silviterrae TaxID=1539049 RepID=A0A4R8DGN9_9BACT|nr:YceI family protein [Dinghuibacter silviterrae]TDW96627.1 YceI-like domain-containing protein [Dinghuibacter silviterrae]